MSGEVRLYSVTAIERIALGKSEGLVRYGKATIAGIAFDKHKTLAAFVEDKDRDGAVKWMLDAEWAGVKKSAARGTDLHQAAEQLALGQEPQIEEHNRGYLDQFVRFLNDFAPEFLMSEAPVYNLTCGYAGTCDGIILLDGQKVLFDIKTTAHAPDSGKTRPPFHEHALQVCAYRHAELVGVLAERRYSGRGQRYYVFDETAHHEPMPETDGAVILVVSPFDYMLVPVRTDEVVWKAWRHLIEIARWQEETSRIVFGPPLSPKRTEVAA